MAILKIAKMGHPVLRMTAKPVADPTATDIRRLAQDMLDTMEDAEGTGLAAPQVHVPLRMVIFYVKGDRLALEDEESSDDVPLTVLINPEIEVLSDSRSTGVEGCLSVPGLMGEVTRPDHIRYRGLDLNGQLIEREAKGFHARVVQHECDHLDGVLYPQRMDDLSTLIFTSEAKHYQEAAHDDFD